MRSKNILAINDPPEMISYLHHLIPTAIIHKSLINDVLFNHFHQIYINCNWFETDVHHVIDLMPRLEIRKTNEYIKVKYYERHHIFQNTIPKIKEFIDNGFFIFSYLNEADFKDTMIHYYKYKIAHPVFIIGYDDNTQNLISYGFDKKMKVRKMRVSYEQFVRTYMSSETEKLINQNAYINNSNAFSILKPQSLQCNKDIELFRNSLNNMLDNANEFYFEIIYSEVSKYIHLYCSNECGPYIDFRIFRILKEHKNIMLKRFKYFSDNSCNSNVMSMYKDQMKIVQYVDKIFSIVLRYEVYQDKNSLLTIDKLLLAIQKKEKSLFSKCLEILEN